MQEVLSSNCQFFLTVCPSDCHKTPPARAHARWTARGSRPISARFSRRINEGNRAMAKVFKERLHKGYAQTMEIAGKPLVEEKSRYQRIKIFDTVANGRVMTLDDIVQITTRDESAYAEMLTHLPLFEHGSGERVMIVGGGDLSIADEALKHKNVKEVVLVDIDEPRDRALPRAFRRDQRQGVRRQAPQDRGRRRVRISRPRRNRKAASISSSPTVPIPSAPARRCSARRSMIASKRAEAGRLRNLPDRRAVLPALGDHRRAEGAGASSSRIRASI